MRLGQRCGPALLPKDDRPSRARTTMRINNPEEIQLIEAYRERKMISHIPMEMGVFPSSGLITGSPSPNTGFPGDGCAVETSNILPQEIGLPQEEDPDRADMEVVASGSGHGSLFSEESLPLMPLFGDQSTNQSRNMFNV